MWWSKKLLYPIVWFLCPEENGSRKLEFWKQSRRRKTFWNLFKKPQTQKTSVVYTIWSTLWTYSFHVPKYMVDNLQTAKVLGYMRPLRSANLVSQETFPWDSPLCQLEILQGQPVQYTTIRWAHCLSFQHCPKHSRVLPGTVKSKRTLLHRKDWGLLDRFLKYGYSSAYQVLSPLLLLV